MLILLNRTDHRKPLLGYLKTKEVLERSPQQLIAFIALLEHRVQYPAPTGVVTAVVIGMKMDPIGLVVVGVALFEKVCHWRLVLKSQMLKPGQLSHSLPAVCQFRCRTLRYLSNTTPA